MSFTVVFFGTPKIAACCLQALIDKQIKVLAVVTKPDMPVGRKQVLTPSEVKVLAQKHQIPVLQPYKVNEISDELAKLKPDLILTCAYGKIIPDTILNIPKFHCINVHTSLLPRWRGGAPIHHAVLNGDKQTGISLVYMTKALDAGPVILQKTITISENETYRSLYDKLATLAYQILTQNLLSLFSDSVKTTKQDQSQVTLAHIISRDDEKIDWNTNAKVIDAKVRGLYDEPIAYTKYQDLNIKIYATSIIQQTGTTPGLIKFISANGILVETHNGCILINKLQLPGKKPMLVSELINGNHPFKVNTKFN